MNAINYKEQPVVAVRWYHTIPGPFARHVVVVLADGREINALHTAFGDAFHFLYAWTEDEATQRAFQCGARDLPGLDSLRPSGHEFSIDYLASLIPADRSCPVPEQGQVTVKAESREETTVADAVSQAAERDIKTPEPLRSKQVKGQDWHDDEDADYVLFGTH